MCCWCRNSWIPRRCERKTSVNCVLDSLRGKLHQIFSDVGTTQEGAYCSLPKKSRWRGLSSTSRTVFLSVHLPNQRHIYAFTSFASFFLICVFIRSNLCGEHTTERRFGSPCASWDNKTQTRQQEMLSWSQRGQLGVAWTRYLLFRVAGIKDRRLRLRNIYTKNGRNPRKHIFC